MSSPTREPLSLPIIDERPEVIAPTPGPLQKQLQSLQQEVMSKPLYVQGGLWRYLKLRWRMDLRQVNPKSLETIAPKWKVNECRSCTENCCVGKKSTVLLRLRDIAMLVDIGREDLITADKPQFDEAAMEGHPALSRQTQSESWQKFPVLKKDGLGACEALDSNGRCTLYPHWPLSCARFPYALRPEDHSVFYSQRCDSFWVRPDKPAKDAVQRMVVAAAAAYNERILDAVLLAYAPRRLEDLGLMKFLTPRAAP